MHMIDIAMTDYGIAPLPNDPQLAMAYIPFQQYNSKVYSPMQALEAGTVYPDLDKPFYGRRCGV